MAAQKIDQSSSVYDDTNSAVRPARSKLDPSIESQLPSVLFQRSYAGVHSNLRLIDRMLFTAFGQVEDRG
jgi:hypothetical protein